MKLFKHNKRAAKVADLSVKPIASVTQDAQPPSAAVATTTAIEPAAPTGDASPATRPVSTLDRFDRMFEEWMLFPFPEWPMDVIEVDHRRDAESLVVRVKLPGIDPKRDVQLTVSDGVLWVDGMHREEERAEDHGYVRHEWRYGAFSRSIPLPDGVTANDVRASYRDGVLEIRIPEPTPRPVATVPITTA